MLWVRLWWSERPCCWNCWRRVDRGCPSRAVHALVPSSSSSLWSSFCDDDDGYGPPSRRWSRASQGTFNLSPLLRVLRALRAKICTHDRSTSDLLDDDDYVSFDICVDGRDRGSKERRKYRRKGEGEGRGVTSVTPHQLWPLLLGLFGLHKMTMSVSLLPIRSTRWYARVSRCNCTEDVSS